MSTEHARHCGGCNGYTASWEDCEGLTEAELAGILEAALMGYTRRNFAGLPVYPQDAKIIDAFRDTLAAKAAGGKPGLRWREQQQGYVLEWYCEPPRPKHHFRVRNEEWATEHGYPVRRVYEIEEIHGVPGSTGGTDSDGPAGPGPAASGQEAPAAPAQGG